MPLPEPSSRNLHLELLAQERLLYERDLSFYTQDFWDCLEPGKRLQWGWHLDAIAEHLSAVKSNWIKDLVINVPPRHLKSMTTSVFFPTWAWTTEPWLKFLMISYGRGLVLRDNNKARRLIKHAKYQQYWADKYQLTEDQNVKSFYETTMGGARMIGSIESGVTGEGGDIIITDDPIQLKDADNKNALDRAIQVWDEELESRLNDPITGRRVLIMQRLNHRDPTGHVLREGGWVHLMLPTRYESKRKCVTFLNSDTYRAGDQYLPGDPGRKGQVEALDGEVHPDAVPFFKDPRTVDGELLFPERFPKRFVDKLEKKGPLIFAGQQQQNPAIAGGTIFKRHWFEDRFYDALPPIIEKNSFPCQTWDCSFKNLEDSAFVAGLGLAKWGEDIFVLPKAFHERTDIGGTIQAINMFSAWYPWIGPKLIEDKANGTAVIQMLTGKIKGLLPQNPTDSKEGRAMAVAYMCQAGNVRLPNPEIYPWVLEMLNELTDFPRGTYKDYVDALTQGLYYYETLASDELPNSELLYEGQDKDDFVDWRPRF